jgi:hypothetical protein
MIIGGEIGAPVRNRTSISAFGGLRHIRWTTGAHYDSKGYYRGWGIKKQVKGERQIYYFRERFGCIERENWII